MPAAQKQILLTNDDGIRSPGLWAAAAALSQLGYVTVVAPREQSSGAGRSLPTSADGRITRQKLEINGQEWEVYAVGGSPAIAVDFGVLEIMPHKPDLIVAGINYGENPGTDITISGTVGAAMEGASFGVPAMAVSLQLVNVSTEFIHYSRKFDFNPAAHFTTLFGGLLLTGRFPPAVDLIKVDVPQEATLQTPWHLTRLAHDRYFTPIIQREGGWEQPSVIGADIHVTPERYPPGTDVHTLIIDRQVSVTPLTLDMTARVDLADLESRLRS
jgi:5'-nucleotidase